MTHILIKKILFSFLSLIVYTVIASEEQKLVDPRDIISDQQNSTAIASSPSQPNTKHSEESSTDDLIEGMEKLNVAVQPSPPSLSFISPTLEPGFFYRMGTESPKRSVKGVYAKQVNYYNQSLLADTSTLKDYVFCQPISYGIKNWFSAEFFGVWRYSKDGEEKTQKVSVPIRVLGTDKKMIIIGSDSTARVYPVSIWRTGDGTAKASDENSYWHIPCNNLHTHTETRFLEYLKKPETQAALWEYFLWKSSNFLSWKLSCIGFNCFSTNDACDSCLGELLELKRNGLPHLPPQNPDKTYTISTLGFPIPILVTYESKCLYNPYLGNVYQLAHNGQYSASLLFYPRPCFLRLEVNTESGEQHTCSCVVDQEEDIYHRDKIEIKDRENLDFIVLMVNSGNPIKARTQPAVKHVKPVSRYSY